MKAKKVLTDRQLLIVTFKQNAKLSARLKTLEDTLLKGNNKDWFNNKDAAKYLNVHPKKLYRLRVDGIIKACREKPLIFKKTDLDNFLNGK